MRVELLGTVQVRDDAGDPAHLGGPRARALLALLALDADRVAAGIRAAASERLGVAGFEAAYQRGRAMPYDEALGFARACAVPAGERLPGRADLVGVRTRTPARRLPEGSYSAAWQDSVTFGRHFGVANVALSFRFRQS